ncbi:zinc-binding alcohol dehydrogenase family protein [Chitinophaga polysaccharea]|uniref:zinc-binding alcohol dehydrogenase family protein n=1 Tax=Chitinophaga polysaccharea TaxID=1293035 RepID=UPI001FFC7E8E|nr:zinc-binding alcohol dehydrogenase family protein [Chitinophaga polysaccharea]
MMYELICSSPGHLTYARTDLPVLTPGHAIIKIKRIGICGTDLHAFEGTQPFFQYPRVLGHELSGELVAFDNAPGFREGEAVTFIPYFSCGTCIACRRGLPNCCEQINVFGVHSDGGMKEYISIPSASLLHGEGLSYEALALVEPLAIGAHAVRRAAIQPGEYVLVTGAGPIGLAAMEFARIAGAQVIALDVNAERLEYCTSRFQVPFAVNARDADAREQVKAITGGDMPTVVMDATGNLQAMNNGIYYLAHGGRYVLVGLQKEVLSFSNPELHKRETTLLCSRNATRADFEHVIRSIQQGLVNPAAYITHHIDFMAIKDTFPSLADPATKVVKAMVTL